MSIEILLKESLHKPPKQIKSTNNNKWKIYYITMMLNNIA
jgi:hypothetical protein